MVAVSIPVLQVGTLTSEEALTQHTVRLSLVAMVILPHCPNPPAPSLPGSHKLPERFLLHWMWDGKEASRGEPGGKALGRGGKALEAAFRDWERTLYCKALGLEILHIAVDRST